MDSYTITVSLNGNEMYRSVSNDLDDAIDTIRNIRNIKSPDPLPPMTVTEAYEYFSNTLDE